VEGFVIIDPEKCTGCGECAAACPYDSIYENEELGIYQKCTGCVHLLDNGYEQPRCVEACPRDALMIEDEETSGDFIFGASVPKPETGNFPRTYYRNIPGRFIAGTIYDPVEKEVVIGAACRATIGGKTYHATTDDYGDFWFNDLPIGKFNVVILAQGFEPKVFDEVSTRESVNLGDIPLERPNP
jgi:NAD-dependent dihydropyrimidine dehydrogenase PreA subunit